MRTRGLRNGAPLNQGEVRAGRARGTACVEFAATLPLLMLLFLGLVETGQAIRVSHKLTQAARAGARLYAVKDIPQDKVYAIIDKNMADAGFSGYTIAFQPSSRSFNHLEPVTVTVSMPVSEITWVGQSFVTGLTFRGSCTMPGDTAND